MKYFRVMEDIVIKKLGNNNFAVIQGEKSSCELYYEEVLGLVSSLIMPEERPCCHWMMDKFERGHYLGEQNNENTEGNEPEFQA